jgi:hypothetical protein
MELNLTHHAFHCGILIFYQLFNWVGIYLYLVFANKMLANLIKAMLSLSHTLGKPYTTLFPHTC